MQPATLLETYNEIAHASRLVPTDGAPTRGECIMLVQDAKHPALAGGVEAWHRYATWASLDPVLGHRDSCNPATLHQLCKLSIIDRWAAAGRPEPERANPDIGFQERGWQELQNDPALLAKVQEWAAGCTQPEVPPDKRGRWRVP